MPNFAQSVARAVGSFVSKVLTPSSHCLMISCLEASKDACSSSDYWKGTLEESKCLKGAMTGAMAKE